MCNSNQAGADGELYAEQDPAFREGDYACPPSVFPVSYQEEEQVIVWCVCDLILQMIILQQVDENYDPTDFLQGLVPGEAPAFQPPPMVHNDKCLLNLLHLTFTLDYQITGLGRWHNYQTGAWCYGR